MKLEMPFSEALERFAGTDPKEMQANMDKAKKRKPPGSGEPPGGTNQDDGVVSLRSRRMRKRNQGR